VIFYINGCKKFVDVGSPKTQVITSTVYTDDATATSAIRGIYSKMMENNNIINYSFTLYSGLSADEFANYSTFSYQIEFVNNALTPPNSEINTLWSSAYQFIYYSNAVIEGLANSKGVTTVTKNQLLGEAKFIRALCYFYLVNLWGDVPLITTSDYRINSVASRTPLSQVYQQIINDLKDAQSLLPASYPTSGRVRPNKYSVTALLARAYLYTGDWVNADAQASSVINNSVVYILQNNLNSVFLANSREAIWQLIPVIPEFNTQEGNAFILINAPINVALSNELLTSFELGDNRRTNWIHDTVISAQSYSYPFKYKVKNGSTITENLMILRLAEQYLIRAEARARQNNIAGSQADINMIRNRAGLSNTIANDQPSLLLAIDKERRNEFFTEFGHRWLDLKRTNKANGLLQSIKGSNWQSTDVLYPIPQSDINNNPNLTQNNGY